MRSPTPPRLASWLLCHQARGYRAESLIGDLAEEYEQGRGAGWYWRQVLLAIARSYLRVLQTYGLRFLMAMVVGWTILLIGNALLKKVWGGIQQELGAAAIAHQLQVPALLYQTIWIFLAACIDLGIGRLIVRIYRPHPRAVAGVFAVSICLYLLPSLSRHLFAVVDGSASIAVFVRQLFSTLLWMSSAWLGALWQLQIDCKAAKEKLR